MYRKVVQGKSYTENRRESEEKHTGIYRYGRADDSYKGIIRKLIEKSYREIILGNHVRRLE